jgi:hypothetical protein
MRSLGELSRYEYIADGLQALNALIEQENIPSIAIPALKVGNGGFEWASVRQIIIHELGILPADILVYESGRD